jgi:predicted MFS family arabinose efflux permease
MQHSGYGEQCPKAPKMAAVLKNNPMFGQQTTAGSFGVRGRYVELRWIDPSEIHTIRSGPMYVTAQPTEVSARQESWGSIVLIYAIGLLAATTIGQTIPVIGQMAQVFHAGSKAGWIVSIPSVVVAVGAVLAGWVVDRLGDKAVLLVGSAIIIAGDFGVAYADSLQWLLSMRVVEGVGYFCTSVAALALLMRTTHGRRRNSALTLWSSYIPMSFAVPLIFAAQLAAPGRWRWAFTGHALVLATLGIIAVFKLPSRGRAAVVSGLALTIRTPGPYVLGLVFASMAFIQTGLLSILPQILMSKYGITIGVAASVGTLGMLFKTAGCLAGGPLLNRGTSPITIAAVGVSLVVAGGVLLVFQPPTFLLAVVVSSVFFFGSGLVVGLWALVPTVAPNAQCLGAVSGVVTQVAIWGVLFGAPAAFAAQAAGGRALETTGIIAASGVILIATWLVVSRFQRADSYFDASTTQSAGH